MTPELRLLLDCVAAELDPDAASRIRTALTDEVDWELFARKAASHGLAGPAGDALDRVAPDLVPDEILAAFRANLDDAVPSDNDPLDRLADITDALAANGIEAIAFKGPALAFQAYGKTASATARDLHFLIRQSELARTVATLRGLGYERERRLTAAQYELIHRLQGQEIMFDQSGIVAVPCTRLVPQAMALDIDHGALWQRAQRTALRGRTMLLPAPEDHCLILAVHGGRELWWKIHAARDFAAFVASQPSLDWSAIARRARAQGCLRMVQLAASLSRRFFGAVIPDVVATMEPGDPAVARIVARWDADEIVSPPDNRTVSIERLQLHDGLTRRARYLLRTCFLPGPQLVAAVALPRRLRFAYIPLAFAHDAIALPLWIAFKRARARLRHARDALATSDLALALMPASPAARQDIKRHQAARAGAKRALATNKRDAAAWHSLGDALSGLRRYRQSIACYDKALAIVPDNWTIWDKRRGAIRASGEAVGQDFAATPRDANAWAVRAGHLWFSGRFTEAAAACDRALELDPDHVVAMRLGIHCRLHSCDWRRRDDDERQIAANLKSGIHVIKGVDHHGICDSEAELLAGSQLTASRIRQFETPLWRGERYRHDRIRIAYVSADLRDHATAYLMAGIFEQHDRSRFETTAISLGQDDGGDMRRRIVAAFDRFIDAQPMTDAEVAALLRTLEIDIAIDLKGYTSGARSEIFARRPAPVQVSYLGFPGTLAASFIDYILADRVVIPEDQRQYYSEQVVYLPHSYYPTDSMHRIAEDTPTRAEAGLPESGFVFACFNSSYKLSPGIFALWMRLLHSVDNSVLWLLETNASATLNLRREAKRHGIAPERLVFAPRKPSAEHLARQRLADISLDTLPCNAHTTATDALWAGLPVLTCMGHTLVGRVAASVLYAIGLPELVTTSLADYEEMALLLARDPYRLAAIRAKLASNRLTEPLFDTGRKTRSLEAAYTAMWQRSQRGEAPKAFTVDECARPDLAAAAHS